MLPALHFSSEVVERCLYLHDMLLPHVANEPIPKEWGALTTTFLLAMAMPLIVIPMERIVDKRRDSPIGDRDKDPLLTSHVGSILSKPFGDSELIGSGKGNWSYFQTAKDEKPSRWLGNKMFEFSRKKDADALPTKKVLQGLRHALAHGNVLYLSANGEGTGTALAEMFAFLWDERLWDERKRRWEVIARNVLVVHQDHFAELIRNWGNLIARSGAMKRLL